MSQATVGSADSVKNETATGRTSASRPVFRLQAFISLTLAFVFVAMVLSGVVLFISPRGRTANWGGWAVWGLSREDWVGFHLIMTAGFVVFSIVHVVLNWRLLWGYFVRGLRSILSGRLELVAAILVFGLITWGAIAAVPPFSEIVRLREWWRDSWEERIATAAIPHLEEIPLKRLGELADVPMDKLLAAFNAIGIPDARAESTLGELAAQLQLTPRELFEQLQTAVPELRRLSQSPGMGGRGWRGSSAEGKGPIQGEAQDNRGVGRGSDGMEPGRGRGFRGGRGFGHGVH